MEEVETFRLCLMKFGLGRWTRIVESGYLPGKTVGQMNNQMQRMIGQQSTHEFQGLHADPQKVFEVNKLREGVRFFPVFFSLTSDPLSGSEKWLHRQHWREPYS